MLQARPTNKLFLSTMGSASIISTFNSSSAWESVCTVGSRSGFWSGGEVVVDELGFPESVTFFAASSFSNRRAAFSLIFS